VARLFFAIWPTPEEQRQLAQCAKALLGDKGRQVAERDIHITLNFLGEVRKELLPAVADLRVVPFEPFTIEIGPMDVWKRGLVVLDAKSAELAVLHRALDDHVRALGLPTEDREFRPHITLARNAEGIKPAPIAPIEWKVDSFCLMQSARTDAGSYQVVRRYPSP